MMHRGLEAIEVLEELESGPKTVSMIAQDLRLPASDVHSILRTLERKGRILRDGSFYLLKRRNWA